MGVSFLSKVLDLRVDARPTAGLKSSKYSSMFWSQEGMCVRYSSHCCNKIPEKSDMR